MILMYSRKAASSPKTLSPPEFSELPLNCKESTYIADTYNDRVALRLY
jgi:hypothetical protein